LLQRQLEGYLAKEGNVGLGKGRLKKRWFVLQGFELHYYKSNDKGKSLGFIPMEKVIAVNIVEDQKKRERYRIVSHAIPYHATPSCLCWSDSSINRQSSRSMQVKSRASSTISGDAYPFDIVTKERIYHLVAESHKYANQPSSDL
jgi:hypothetical protein